VEGKKEKYSGEGSIRVSGRCEAADPWVFFPLPYSEDMTQLE
jgi:hypothetical protein